MKRKIGGLLGVFSLALALFFVGAFFVEVEAGEVVSYTFDVKDSEGDPIKGAEIDVDGEDVFVTASSGQVSFVLPSGTYDYSVSRFGYQSQTGLEFTISGVTKIISITLTELATIEISTIEDLDNIRTHLSGNYILANNLDFEDDSSYEDPSNKDTHTTGEGWEPIGEFSPSENRFTGTFDGGGYTISNLFINRAGSNYQGLFGYLGGGAEIINGGLIDVDVTGQGSVGGLVGRVQGISSDHSAITNVYTTGTVVGDSQTVGGLIGSLVYGEIADSHSLCSVSSSHANVGGLVGWITYGDINNSYATGDVNAGNNNIGGLVGQAEGSSINNSYATGTVNQNDNCIDYIGGLIGLSWGSSIYDSHATGDVWGVSYVGGLIGRNDASAPATISGSYATGDVIGEDYVGGLIGSNYGDLITDSYATGGVTGNHRVGGLVGSNINGEITNSHSTSFVSVSGSNIGGLVGENQNGEIENSYATGNVTSSGGNRVGGLVGVSYVGSPEIRSSYATGDVEGRDYTGGLVGQSSKTSIYDSYATGDVEGNDYTGGLIGKNDNLVPGTVNNSYATGNVVGEDYVGGLVGYNEDELIINSYSIGNVEGDDWVGGLVGYNNNGTVDKSYAVGSVEGDDYIGGLVGSNQGVISSSYWNTETSLQSSMCGEGDGCDDNNGKTTSQMKQMATFSGWSMGNSSTNLNDGYPYLAWQDDKDSHVWLIFQATSGSTGSSSRGRAQDDDDADTDTDDSEGDAEYYEQREGDLRSRVNNLINNKSRMERIRERINSMLAMLGDEDDDVSEMLRGFHEEMEEMLEEIEEELEELEEELEEAERKTILARQRERLDNNKERAENLLKLAEGHDEEEKIKEDLYNILEEIAKLREDVDEKLR